MAEEIELKFKLDDAAVYEQWAQAQELAGAYRVTTAPTATIQVVDSYLDTPDFRFLRHGWAVRQRETGTSVLLSLKTLPAAGSADQTHADHTHGGNTGPDAVTSLHRRVEVEAPLDERAAALTPATWPAELQAQVETLIDPKTRLGIVAVIRQTRAKRLVSYPQSDATEPDIDGPDMAPSAESLRAEMSVDSVDVLAPESDQPLVRRHELEVELLHGAVEHLHTLATFFSEDAGLAPQTGSKFEDALRTLAVCTPIGHHDDIDQPCGIYPQMHMAEAARLILAEQLLAMLLNEPGVRYRDDIEYVHRLRVATRRARVVLDVFAPFLKAKHVDFLRRRLRKTGRLLGAVRDLDVALANAALADAQGGAAVPSAALRQRWQDERTHAFTALLAWLDSNKYAKFISRFNRFVRTPCKGAHIIPHEAGKRPVAQEVRHVVPVLLTAQFAAVRSYESLFQGEQTPDYATIHRLRIDAKYLRYELEFFRSVLGPSCNTLIKQLKKLQDHLGRLNDAVVAVAKLESGSDANGEARRHREEQREIVRTLSAETPHLLAQFCREKNRRYLGSAIAAL